MPKGKKKGIFCFDTKETPEDTKMELRETICSLCSEKGPPCAVCRIDNIATSVYALIISGQRNKK